MPTWGKHHTLPGCHTEPRWTYTWHIPDTEKAECFDIEVPLPSRPAQTLKDQVIWPPETNIFCSTIDKDVTPTEENNEFKHSLFTDFHNNNWRVIDYTHTSYRFIWSDDWTSKQC